MEWIDPDQAADAIRRGRGRGVKIAILDSGIEVGHPLLRGMQLADDLAIVAEGNRLRIAAGDGQDELGHGTAVASVAFAGAPEATFGCFRVLGGRLHSRTAIIWEGARAAIERGYHIINCSFGCGVKEHCDKFKAWVDEAYLRGIHVVAACNNNDPSHPEWPAFFTSVIAVNMADAGGDDELFHMPASLVEFAARGVDVDVAWCGGDTKKMTGSSFAAPRVAGMLARLLAVHPGLTPLQAKALFQAYALANVSRRLPAAGYVAALS